jgi:transcription-repair coupling factor (superfamily II helicase)
VRLAFYRRLARIESLEEVEELARELVDRFGKLPAAVDNLLYGVRIKLLALRAGVQSISTEDKQVVIRFREGIKPDRSRLEGREGVQILSNQLRLPLRNGGWRRALEEVLWRLIS